MSLLKALVAEMLHGATIEMKERTKGENMNKREQFNLTHPETANYTKCQQGKDFMKLYPVVPPGEVPIPVISQKGNLSRDEAAKELQSLSDLVPPRYGWVTSLEIRIEQRKVDLSRMIANTFLRKD